MSLCPGLVQQVGKCAQGAGLSAPQCVHHDSGGRWQRVDDPQQTQHHEVICPAPLRAEDEANLHCTRLIVHAQRKVLEKDLERSKRKSNEKKMEW